MSRSLPRARPEPWSAALCTSMTSSGPCRRMARPPAMSSRRFLIPTRSNSVSPPAGTRGGPCREAAGLLRRAQPAVLNDQPQSAQEQREIKDQEKEIGAVSIAPADQIDDAHRRGNENSDHHDT